MYVKTRVGRIVAIPHPDPTSRASLASLATPYGARSARPFSTLSYTLACHAALAVADLEGFAHFAVA